MNLSNFKNVALHFSGGKDSLALLYAFKPFLEKITVYHLNTGDMPPETYAIIEQVKEWIPHFKVIKSDSKAWRAENGMPTDLLPTRSEFLGVLYGMSDTRMVSRFQCCSTNVMAPMHRQMIEDGVDCVIRGTKLCDTGKVPFEGQSPYYHVLLPLKDWTHEMVFEYLRNKGAPWNPIYENFGVTGLECMTCTAWWDDGKAKFFAARHPEQLTEYRVNLQTIRKELLRSLQELNSELGEA
jgi:phosphoadenosine phosphosulfate reductase